MLPQFIDGSHSVFASIGIVFGGTNFGIAAK